MEVQSDYPVGQVRILGCVKRLGAYWWQPNMALGEIVTRTGGTTDCARRIALYHDPVETIIPSRVFPLIEVESQAWAEVLRIGDTIWVEKSGRLDPPSPSLTVKVGIAVDPPLVTVLHSSREQASWMHRWGCAPLMKVRCASHWIGWRRCAIATRGQRYRVEIEFTTVIAHLAPLHVKAFASDVGYLAKELW